jgi:glyoxylase I family protein
MSECVLSKMGFHHIALRCKDFDKSVAFYKAIGLKPCIGWGEAPKRVAMLELGNGGRIELFEGGTGEKTESPSQSGEWFHLAIASENPDVSFEAAMNAGATQKYAPYDMVLGSTPPTPVRLAFVCGPDGEVIEFFREKE